MTKKSLNLSIEAVFKQIHIEPVSVHIDLFKLVDIDVNSVMFHEHS